MEVGFVTTFCLRSSPFSGRNYRERSRTDGKSWRAAVTGLPASYGELLTNAETAIKNAVRDGLKLCEVQFPPVAKSSTSAALSETMDANRMHVRELIRGFVANTRVCVAFPDKGEAKLATKAWETETIDQPFTVSTIEKASEDQDVELFFVMNPGFNVDEYLNIERFDDKKRSVVVINGDLDRIRGGYYPRIFYPKLHQVAQRCLRQFEPVYYLKGLANRGFLVRSYPEPWKLLFTSADGTMVCLLESVDRPAYSDLERMLRNAVDEEKLNSK